jgi:hypothetical protein
MHTDMSDVFLTLYVFKLPESVSIQKPHGVEYLERVLQTPETPENETGDPSPENE